MKETIPYLPGSLPVAAKEMQARFAGGRLSSDGVKRLGEEIAQRHGDSV